MRSDSSARRLWQNAALALLSVVVSLALVEIGLRLFWSDFYLKFRPELPTGNRRFHAERGWSLVPGVRVTQGDTEFTVTQTHNSLGFRGPEIAPKSPDRPRVLVLGDSMTYGHGVEDAETFSAVLQQLEPGLEVINAGVPGYSGVEELLLLRTDGMRLAPDLVILGFFWNDVMDAAQSRYARFELDAGGALRGVPPSPASQEHPIFQNEQRRLQRRLGPAYRMLSWSYTYRFASDRLKLLHLLIDDWWQGAQAVPGLDAAERESAWQLSFALIREMRDVARQGGADFLLLGIPDQVQIEDGTSVAGAGHYLREVPERLREFAQAEGIAFLDLVPPLRAARAQDAEPYFYRFDRHWNALGHRRAAEALRDELRSSGWLSKH